MNTIRIIYYVYSIFILLIFLSNCDGTTHQVPSTRKADIDCPFKFLKARTVHERTTASVGLSTNMGAAIENIKKTVPLNFNAIIQMKGEVHKAIDKYEHEPIDSVLACNYNYQVSKICGLINMIKQQSDGEEKSINQSILKQAIARMFNFMEDYRLDKRPLRVLTNYNTTNISLVDELYPEKILTYLNYKILNSADNDTRKYWQTMLDVNQIYIQQCTLRPDYKNCLESLWQKVQQIEYHN